MKNSEGIGAKRTQHNAFLWVALTQRLASTVARSKLSVSLLLALEVNSASHSPWVVRQVVSQSTMKFASCDDDPGNSVNAYLWSAFRESLH
ncbi:hypothetical protein [Leptospira noguchii]|uniref:Uncharacterized protein n=1 Tax=Leptospira noguchii TaxID=28182 RepID=A0AAE9GHC9_9LEPT|nr:hypothetical protein [Leptospira noguchii]UOG56543.1 hypothetical protein MAL03_17440 [Leptospira noguchii]